MKNLFKNHKMYGTTVVGTKGQIVIPVQARKDLKIVPGDTLVVVGKMGAALGLVKADALASLVNLVMKGIETVGNEDTKSRFRKHAEEILKAVSKK